MVMSDRSYNTEGYRYGMNGQEKVDEITSGHYTAEYWEYDARIGRRWNPDPIVLPWESPYATFNNNPIVFSDPSGASSGQGEPVKETQPDYDPSKDKTSVVGQEVEVTAKRPEWQPQNYGEIKSAYRQQVRNDFATDKRQQGWYGQSPPEKYMRDLADAQLREFYRQSWVNSKFGAGKLEHWVGCSSHLM